MAYIGLASRDSHVVILHKNITVTEKIYVFFWAYITAEYFRILQKNWR